MNSYPDTKTGNKQRYPLWTRIGAAGLLAVPMLTACGSSKGSNGNSNAPTATVKVENPNGTYVAAEAAIADATSPTTESIQLPNGIELGSVCLTGINGQQLEAKVFTGDYAGDQVLLAEGVTITDLQPLTGSILPDIESCG
jgi:hypothetical protein